MPHTDHHTRQLVYQAQIALAKKIASEKQLDFQELQRLIPYHTEIAETCMARICQNGVYRQCSKKRTKQSILCGRHHKMKQTNNLRYGTMDEVSTKVSGNAVPEIKEVNPFLPDNEFANEWTQRCTLWSYQGVKYLWDTATNNVYSTLPDHPQVGTRANDQLIAID